MADAQAPVEAAVPAAQALIQVPPVSAANDEHPQYNPATLQIQFLLVSLLRFSPARVRPFAFPSPLSSTRLLVCIVFSIVFVLSFFILSFVRLCFAQADLAVLLGFCHFCTLFICKLSVRRLAITGFV